MPKRKPRLFDSAVEAARNKREFLDSVQKMLPYMTNEQVYWLIRSLVEET